MRKIGPGLYIDRSGNAHFDAVGMCEEIGVPPTPENLAAAEAGAADAMQAAWPGARVTPVGDD